MARQYWRMRFRWGNGGKDGWPHCFNKGVAAIGYSDDNDKPIPDCSNLSLNEYVQMWRKRRLGSPSPNSNLRFVRYEMEIGDIIYAQKGRYIVGKGIICSGYKHDRYLFKGTIFDRLWHHYRKVKWTPVVPKIEANLGAPLLSVLKLEIKRVKAIEMAISRKVKASYLREVDEGKRYKAEAEFRVRNKAIIDAKKAGSDYCCEVCKMNFGNVYGLIGSDHIIAHHIKPIGLRKRSSKTTLTDIVLVCANCHDMLHTQSPPLNIATLKSMMK